MGRNSSGVRGGSARAKEEKMFNSALNQIQKAVGDKAQISIDDYTNSRTGTTTYSIQVFTDSGSKSVGFFDKETANKFIERLKNKGYKFPRGGYKEKF